MNNLVKALHNYFIPPYYRNDEQEFRKARIFINTTLITAFFAFFFLLNTIFFQMPYHRWSMIICTIVFLSLAFLFRSGVSLLSCANIYVLMAVIATFWDGFYLGGLQSYDFAWMCLPPVIAVMIGSTKVGWLWLILTVIVVSVMGILQLKGYPFLNAIKPEFEHIHGLNSIISLVVIMFVVVLVMESAFQSSLVKLDQKNKIIEEEKKRSDELLLNILPQEVMEELKETGKTTAKNYKLVTVLFADFKDFTIIAEQISPEILVSSIDEYFKLIDQIITDYPIEKIKTVGDAYICASGLPLEKSNNPEVMVQAALDIIAALNAMNIKRLAENKTIFEMRIGIHSGPLVAGVVGVKKFAYDIWGDTVNTAARMQQNGDPGKINISGTTCELVKHLFNCTYRGRMEVKHKGLIDMYFVDGRKLDV